MKGRVTKLVRNVLLLLVFVMFVNVVPVYATGQTDEEYIQSLKTAGFPDSYCAGLLELHKSYPNWQFVPVKTGLDWNYVIENESAIGRNLVQSSVNDARKSTDTRAYDWNTNTWYGFDGADWVCASPSYISYCMDPRNFFDATYIFQFETLEYEDYQTEDGVKNILKNSFMTGDYNDRDGVTRNYASSFVEIGKGLDVSPYHLASRCLQEQGTKGTSPLISGVYETYEGYYNHFNVGAYTTSTASATLNGLAYAKRAGWDSIYKSLSGGSAVVADRYVKKGQNTVYFEKFNVVNEKNLFSHQYMTNAMAAFSEGSKISKAYTDKTAAFVFLIPVYENMPAEPAAIVDNGNPNNWLSSLSAEGYGLTPSFKAETTEYSLIVPEKAENITIKASAVSGKATVLGAGNYPLSMGDNNIVITCTAENGTSRTYKLCVVRQAGLEGTVPTPETDTPATDNSETILPETGAADDGSIVIADGVCISTTYKVEGQITGISAGILAQDIVANLSGANSNASVQKKDGTEQTDVVGTGDKIIVSDANGNVADTYEVIIYGDINGDGKISNTDLVLLTKHILDTELLTDSYLTAADVEQDGKISNRDLVVMQKHILGIEQ